MNYNNSLITQNALHQYCTSIAQPQGNIRKCLKQVRDASGTCTGHVWNSVLEHVQDASGTRAGCIWNTTREHCGTCLGQSVQAQNLTIKLQQYLRT